MIARKTLTRKILQGLHNMQGLHSFSTKVLTFFEDILRLGLIIRSEGVIHSNINEALYIRARLSGTLLSVALSSVHGSVQISTKST